MIPTYTNHSATHWKKWPGRTACGSAIPPSSFGTGRVDCPACQDLLAAWYPDAIWRLKSDAPLRIFEVPVAAGYSYKEATAMLKELRRQQFRWKKACGFFPKLWLEMDPPLEKPVPFGLSTEAAG